MTIFKFKKNKTLGYSIVLFICLNTVSCISKTEIDLIAHNASLYSLNDNSDVFEAIAVNNGKIIALGKNNQLLNKYKAKTVLDLEGKFVYPGFISIALE